MSAITELKILNSIVAINDNGLFSLNDLWKASGGEPKNQPRRWVQLKRTKNVIDVLKNRADIDGNTVDKSVIFSSNKAGTFVNRVLVYSYAMHVSAEFEIEVINAFDKQAQKKLKQAKVEWQQNRELGKLTHRKETDTIKIFLDYAGAQGSNNYPKHGYSLIAKMINSALRIEDREAINEDTLHLLSTAETITENSLQAGMNQQLPYKVIFQQAKSDVMKFSEMAVPFELEI